MSPAFDAVARAGVKTAIVGRVSLFKRRSKDLFAVPERGAAAPDGEAAAREFRLTVVDIFAIAGRGTVVTGLIETGVVVTGARVTIERQGRPPLETVIAAIETARKKTKQAGTGDNVGLLLRGVDRSEIVSGDVVRSA